MPGTELFGAEEKKEINDVLETGILMRYTNENLRNNHWKALDFENEVKKITQAKFAHAVSSGTAAVATALVAAGIGAGDHVIVPPFTFIATIEAVLFVGAIPIFAEIDETLCLSAKGIEDQITTQTKAVCLVHMCGEMANMDEILAVIKKYNLLLVEDAGQAFAASFKGKSVGLFGVAGAYSFDFFKIATAGEGGIVVTNNESIYKICETYSDHGHDHIGSNRGMENHPIIGFNFRISELHAAVGVAQTRRIPSLLAANRKNKLWLKNRLKHIPGVTFSKLVDPDGDSSTFLNILLPSGNEAIQVVDQLTKAGIGGFNYWFKNMYHFINQWDHLKAMRTASTLPAQLLGIPQNYETIELPKSQEVISRLISFGIKCTWKEEEMENLASWIEKCINNIVIKHA